VWAFSARSFLRASGRGGSASAAGKVDRIPIGNNPMDPLDPCDTRMCVRRSEANEQRTRANRDLKKTDTADR